MSTHGISTKAFGEPAITYTFRTLPASKGTEVWAAVEPLVPNVGNSLSAAAAVGGKELASIMASDDVPAHEKEAVLATVAMLSAISQLPEDDWVAPGGGRMMGRARLTKIMFDHVSVGGKPVDVDINFTGRLVTMKKVLGEAMRFNFADFFSGLAAVTDSLRGVVKPE